MWLLEADFLQGEKSPGCNFIKMRVGSSRRTPDTIKK